MTSIIEVERPLALFTQGIINRLPTFVDRSRDVLTFELKNAFELFLPPEIEYFANEQNNRDVYRWLTMQQLAFQLYKTFKFDLEIARSNSAFLQQHTVSSGLRTPHLELFYQHFPSPELAQELFYVLESARVRELMLHDFPGAKRLYTLYQRSFQVKTTTQSGDLTLADLLTFELANAAALTPAVQSLVGEIFRTNATVYTSANATINVYLAFAQHLDPEIGESALNDQDEQVDLAQLQRSAKLEDWREELSELDATLLAMSFAETAGAKQGVEGQLSEGLPRESEVDVEELEREREQLKRRVDMESSLLSQYTRTSIADQPYFRYDEWDYLNQRWLRHWCKLFEVRDAVSQVDTAMTLLDQIRHMIPTVRKQFEQVKPAGMRRVSHVVDGDEVDIDALVEARTDIRAGSTPDDRVYSQMARLQRDVSACFLVDLSASTDDPVEAPSSGLLEEDGEDPFDDPFLHGINFDPDQEERETPRKIVDILKESVLLLAAAVEDLGDLYSVYGFSGYSRDCVEVHIAKDFNESLSLTTTQAIASMKPLRSTRMGPAIRHACHRLITTGASLKVLMVISDGFPQDCDYGPDRGDHEYGIQDTAMAIREAGIKGIQVFCITVDLSGHDYLKRMCPDNRYLVIEETDELPQALQQVYRQLTN